MLKMNSKTSAIAIAVLIMAAILSACGTPATPEPTPDMNAYATNAVQTVEAHYTATALAQPTNTPEPTYTPVVLPTDTPEPIAVLPPAASSGEGAPAPADPSVPILPIIDINAQNQEIQEIQEIQAVPTATAALTGDKASYDSQNPLDGTHVEAGSEFDITWYLLNTGTTTWTTDYCLRYFTGTNFTKPGKPRTYLAQAVPPNTVGACTVDAVAPTAPGTYSMSVVLGNENDENFFIVDITIIVD